MIPVNTPIFTGNEKKYLAECIDSGWVSSDGPFVQKFEEGIASYVDRSHGVSCSNGTAALEIALKALGIGYGDEVIMPSHTIISCAQAVTKLGAIPVLVDSELDTWNMDLSNLDAHITSATKAIMLVHLYGLPANVDAVLAAAKAHKLYVIEDAAEMLGQTFKGNPCGSFGDISCFSFYPNKHITCGEGGMCVTNNQDLAEKCRSLRNLCFSNPRFVHEDLGWNYRMTNLQAAVGLAQLEKIDVHVERKREIGNLYNQYLIPESDYLTPLKSTSFAENIYWVYGIVLAADGPNGEDLISYLRDCKVGARPFFYPIHKQPVYQRENLFRGQVFFNSELLANKGFYIPSGLGTSNEDIFKVSMLVNKFFGR
jgi:perosamine synthetase